MHNKIGRRAFIAAVIVTLIWTSTALAQDNLYLANGSIPTRLYKVDLATNTATFLMNFTKGSTTFHAIAVTVDGGNLVAFDRNGTTVVSVDLNTLMETKIGDLPLKLSTAVVQASFDLDGTLYFTDRFGDALYTIESDLSNISTPTFVGSIAVDVEGVDIAFDSSGTLYMLNNTNFVLYRVDTSDASLTSIGFVNIPTNNMGMAFAPDFDNPLIIACNNDRLYTVSTSDASITDLGKLNSDTFNINSGDMARVLWWIPVDIDIKPGSWPNCIKNNSRGVVSVAVLGSPTFDVNDIFDPSGVKLGVAPPIRWSLEDVNGDGVTDLVFKFMKSDLAGFLGDGEVLTLEGNLWLDSTTTIPFKGSDVVYLPGGDVCETTAALIPGWDRFWPGGGSVSWEYSPNGSEVTVTYLLQDVLTGQYHVYPDFFNPGDLLVDPGVHVGDLWGDVSYFTHGKWTREGNTAFADVWTGTTVNVTDTGTLGDGLGSASASYTFSAKAGTYFVQFAVAPGNRPGAVVYRTGTAYGVGFEELVFK